MKQSLRSVAHKTLQMSGIFCNHVLISVCLSFEKHSSSSLRFASDPSTHNYCDINHPLPHLRWKRRVGEELQRKQERESKKKKKRKKLWVFTVCLTSLPSINIIHALKLAWRRVQGRPGVSSHHHIPLATSTHTHQSITPQAAHND